MVAMDAAQARGLSSAAFFVDIASAFAEVQRCLVVEDFGSVVRLGGALVAQGIEEVLACEIAE